MSQSNVIRILIADDHPILGQALKMFLECEPDITVVGYASDGRKALELFRKHQPDMAVMDLQMPKMGGADAIAEGGSSTIAAICAKFKHARIVVLTGFDGDEDIYRGLRAGAKGYILKQAEPKELLDAIRTVYKGQKYIPPSIAAKLAERMGSPELSDRELEVLRLIAKGKNNQQISAALNIVESTVRFHANNIFSKLNASDRTQALVTALNRGIVRL
ncbi:response regulator transcription factor [Scytonema hofmannii FACHB-248]|uniref:Response regulator transcription factor n=1 Tax=Scytonema hofmannii FACHB-248 TaxID=1842502 RepID=A0ABR8GYE6_9CYAN|nr:MULTISPECIES: response regulator transcription factor [Nostocales]MBD2608264.1 response regulator transcription factor [Scytonema hofmannii FACHB-248]